jgi:hypothetical protein
MATLYLRKLYDSFVPTDELSAEAMEAMLPNTEFKAELTRPRNYKFHQKFFTLIDVAYKAWEGPVIEHKGEMIRASLDRFRKDIQIMCGYYEIVVNIRGELRKEAKSISFANMEQDEFEKLYSTAIDVILGKVLSGYTKDDLDEQVNRILRFC